VNPCEPREWMEVNGLDEDLACHSSWGQGMFMELEHWTCTGEKGLSASSAGDSDSETLEQCAEECKLANTHWYGFSAKGFSPDAAINNAFYCEGFTFNENEKVPCVLYKELKTMRPTASIDADSKVLDVGGTNMRCFVQKELPNPCMIDHGEWLRDNKGEFFYMGMEGFLYAVSKNDEGKYPKCNGESIFGQGRSSPRSYCNGYAASGSNGGQVDLANAPDIQCSKCVDHMIRHDLMVSAITGDASSCGYFGSYWAKTCAGQEVHMSCPTGVSGRGGRIQVISTGEGQATFSRAIGEKRCTTMPLDERGARKFQSATKQCGYEGNVQNKLASLCNGKKRCKFSADSGTLGDQGCPDVYKAFSVEYKCL